MNTMIIFSNENSKGGMMTEGIEKLLIFVFIIGGICGITIWEVVDYVYGKIEKRKKKK